MAWLLQPHSFLGNIGKLQGGGGGNQQRQKNSMAFFTHCSNGTTSQFLCRQCTTGDRVNFVMLTQPTIVGYARVKIFYIVLYMGPTIHVYTLCICLWSIPKRSLL
jgi:hypothetical protein